MEEQSPIGAHELSKPKSQTKWRPSSVGMSADTQGDRPVSGDADEPRARARPGQQQVEEQSERAATLAAPSSLLPWAG